MKRIWLCAIALMWGWNAMALDVLFRMDDLMLINDSAQNRVLDVFAQEQVPIHVGIIPCAQDGQFLLCDDEKYIARMKNLHQNGILHIALHGYSHTGNPKLGEMPQYNYEQQRLRLEQGSRFLDSLFETHVHLFIPPWNRYDANTLDILSNLGYDAISADMRRDKFVPNEHFAYYPEGTANMATFARVVRKHAARKGLLVWMIHGYDFTCEKDYRTLQELLREVKTNETVHVVTVDTLLTRNEAFDIARMEQQIRPNTLTQITDLRPIIMPTDELQRWRRYNLLMWIVLATALMLMVYFAFCTR